MSCLLKKFVALFKFVFGIFGNILFVFIDLFVFLKNGHNMVWQNSNLLCKINLWGIGDFVVKCLIWFRKKLTITQNTYSYNYTLWDYLLIMSRTALVVQHKKNFWDKLYVKCFGRNNDNNNKPLGWLYAFCIRSVFIQVYGKP